jgi:hypothetical protein
MKYAIALCTIFITGCTTTVPVKQEFPEVPEVLLRPCPELDIIQSDQIKFSEFLKTVTENYKKYHGCADKQEAWKQWYEQQKEKFNEVK